MQKSSKENILEEKPNIISNESSDININKDPPQSSDKKPLEKTKLSQKYVFWFRISEEILKNKIPKQNLDSSEYESQVKKIAEFDTIEDFWAIFQHLKKPDKCNPGIEFQMFKENIKPMWEDEYNKKGGKLTLKLNKGYTTVIWEEIILGIIGNILPKHIMDGINGVVFCAKKEFNTLQIWFKEYDRNYYMELEQCFRDLIQIPNEVPIDIKKFFFEKNSNYNNIKENNKEENKKYEKNNYHSYGGYTGGYQNNNYKKNKGYYY